MQKDHKKATSWFEDLYKENYKQNENIPWAQMKPNEHLLEYIKLNPSSGKALVVGCGLGDDAVVLSQAGYDVTAIDISHSAIKWCQERFDECEVEFIVQDVFELPQDMVGAYDFVFESLTIQSLPIEFREKIITAIASLLSQNGKILVVAHAKDEESKKDGPPWPLEQEHIDIFKEIGLSELEFKIIDEPTMISASKYRALYQKS